MNRLLRKHLKTAAICCLGTFPVITTGMYSRGADSLWLSMRSYEIALLSLVGFVLGYLTGASQHLAELTPAVRDWLRHRGISRSHSFRLRVLANLIVIGVSYPAAIGLVAFIHRSLTPYDDLITLGRALDLLALSTVAISGYAFGVFSIVTYRSLARTVVYCSIVAMVLMFGSSFILTPSPTQPWSSPAAFALFQVIFAIVLLGVSARRYLDSVDLDRPVSMRSQYVIGSAAIVTLSALTILVIGTQQAKLEPSSSFPKIRELDNHDLALSGRELRIDLRIGEGGDLKVAPSPGKLTGDSPIFDPAMFVRYGSVDPRDSFLRSRLERTRDFVLGGERIPLNDSFGPQFYFRPESGRIEFILEYSKLSSDLADKAPLHFFLDRPDGKSFSKFTHFVQAKSTTSYDDDHAPRKPTTTVLFDPEDGSLWLATWTGGQPTLQSIPLPNGDRVVTLDPLSDADLRDYIVGFANRRLIGERATYEFAAGAIREIGPPPTTRYRARVEDRGEFCEFRVVVEDTTSGKAVASVGFKPETEEEIRGIRITRALSMLRPPVLSVIAHFSGREIVGDDFSQVIVHDPIVRSGRGRTILFGMLAIAIVLAVIAARRLRRLGAEHERIAFWSIAILASGPIGFLVYRVNETNRAWATTDDESEEPELLIRSVA